MVKTFRGARLVMPTWCSIKDCYQKPRAKGLCKKHYYAKRWQDSKNVSDGGER